jgi:uncharacterized cysteine cluster protein YcgN (CxxCxxCC family)
MVRLAILNNSLNGPRFITGLASGLLAGSGLYALDGTSRSSFEPLLRRMTAVPKRPSDQDGFFWKTKTLEEMSNAEWESLCDGCGRCCLNKLEDEDTGDIYFTHVGCRLLDAGTCGCKDYPNRSDKVPDCVRLTPANVRTLNWLPPSCGYKLVAEGRDLYWWHPLVSGDPNTVHEAGVSVRGRVEGTEQQIPDEELEHHIVQWPGQLPKRARLKRRPKD